MSYDAERHAALCEAQHVGYKRPDQFARASRAARRKAKDPRRLWSFIEPTPAEVAQVEAIERRLEPKR